MTSQSRSRRKIRSQPHRTQRTILLAEDDPDIRRVLQAVLEHAGYTVMTAADGNTALRLGRECGARIDLLLTDLVLPGINGVDLADLFQMQWPETKAMLLSGQIKESLLRDVGLRIPVVTKPVMNADLVRTIRAILQGTPSNPSFTSGQFFACRYPQQTASSTPSNGRGMAWRA
jgi:DNA-binding response OmpR family regulator